MLAVGSWKSGDGRWRIVTRRRRRGGARPDQTRPNRTGIIKIGGRRLYRAGGVNCCKSLIEHPKLYPFFTKFCTWRDYPHLIRPTKNETRIFSRKDAKLKPCPKVVKELFCFGDGWDGFYRPKATATRWVLMRIFLRRSPPAVKKIFQKIMRGKFRHELTRINERGGGREKAQKAQFSKDGKGKSGKWKNQQSEDRAGKYSVQGAEYKG